MFRNIVGPKDRVYRTTATIILVLAYFSTPEFAWKWVALFSGLYLLFTAKLSSYVAYSVIGRNTNQEVETETPAKS